ncbi:MAG TPA: hypothetical protein VHC49_07620 [Mycobacteriales bacterium]|nr:hypothetical protein [Mycobacteriales bacterium]
MSELIRTICAETRRCGGTTADLHSLVVPTDQWYFPRFPEHTQIVSLADLPSSLERFVGIHRAVLAGGLLLGTWINPDNRMCYLDLITRVAAEHRALELARHYSRLGGRDIVAICNPVRGITRRVH